MFWGFFNYNFINNWFMPNFRYNYTAFNNFYQPARTYTVFKPATQSYKPTKTYTSSAKKSTKKTYAPKQTTARAHAAQKVTAMLRQKKSFLTRTKEIAQNLNCDYRDLLAVMNAESGLKANAKNGNTAVGLIQFTNDSISELNRIYGYNLTKDKIANMSATEQLDYVEKYLKIVKNYKFSSDKKLNSGDLYSLVFLPGRANQNILTRSGENFYTHNKGLDINKDGLITKNELAQRVERFSVNESIFA